MWRRDPIRLSNSVCDFLKDTNRLSRAYPRGEGPCSCFQFSSWAWQRCHACTPWVGEVDGVCREVLETMASILMVGVRVELVGAWACRLRATLSFVVVSQILSRVAVSLRPCPVSRCL